LKIESLETEKKQLDESFSNYKKTIKEEISKLETENSDLQIQINQLKSSVEEQALHIQTITKANEESELLLKASLDEKEKNLLELRNKVQTKNAAIRRANADSNEAQIIITAREQDIKYRDQVIANLDSEKNKLNMSIRDLEAKVQIFNTQENEKVEKLQRSLHSSQTTISNLQKEIIVLRTNIDSSFKRNGSDSKENLEDRTHEINQVMQDSLTKFSEFREKKEREIQKLKNTYEERIKELEQALNSFNDESQYTNMNSQSVLFSLKKSNELLKIQLEESQKLQEQLRAYSKKNDETIISLRKEVSEKIEVIKGLEKELTSNTKTKFKLIEGSSYKYESELIYVKALLEQKEEEIKNLKTEIGKLLMILRSNSQQSDQQLIEPMTSPRTNKLRWPGLHSDKKVNPFEN
jgi:chromosome segregation ATPase